MRIQVEADPDPDDVAILERGIAEAIAATTHHHDLRELAAFVRDEGGTVRGRCFGGLLLEWVENEAGGRGCRQLVRLTGASQTPDLYGRWGYELVGRVDDHPIGDAALWFRKALDA